MLHPRAVVFLILLYSICINAFTLESVRLQQQRRIFPQGSNINSIPEDDTSSSSSSSSSSSGGGSSTSNNGVSNDDILLNLANERMNTQTRLTPEMTAAFNTAIDELADPVDNLDVNGNWRLVATISPDGDNVDFFSVDSWKNYIDGSGPSPFQSLITGSSRVNGLSQFLTDKNFDNVVEFQIGPVIGKLVLIASLERIENNKRVFRFQNGYFLLKTIWGSSVALPYPVPFKLLGDRAIGYLETIGYNEETGIRAAIGNKGTRFIFQKKIGIEADLSNDIIQGNKIYNNDNANGNGKGEVDKQETNEEEKINNAKITSPKRKRPVVICPQQFGGKPGDYTTLIDDLRQNGHPVYLARISWLGWLSIIKSVPTAAYFKGELEPSKALPFYMDAINDAVQRMHTNEGDESEYALLSHSIGGWVARSWLGEIADEGLRNRCKKFVSLGTPHLAPPEDSIVSKVDQTRGLLKYINDKWPGAYYSPSIEYTCVATNGVTGKVGFDLDSLLAFTSYLALGGDGNVDGDGITPISSAILEGANKIIVGNNDVYHADILPNPIGARNTKLIECKWYGDNMSEWIEAL